MKKLTGAQVIALGGDAGALEAGQDNSAGDSVVWWRTMSIGNQGRGYISLGGVTFRASGRRGIRRG